MWRIAGDVIACIHSDRPAWRGMPQQGRRIILWCGVRETIRWTGYDGWWVGAVGESKRNRRRRRRHCRHCRGILATAAPHKPFDAAGTHCPPYFSSPGDDFNSSTTPPYTLFLLLHSALQTSSDFFHNIFYIFLALSTSVLHTYMHHWAATTDFHNIISYISSYKLILFYRVKRNKQMQFIYIVNIDNGISIEREEGPCSIIRKTAERKKIYNTTDILDYMKIFFLYSTLSLTISTRLYIKNSKN